MKKNLHDDTEIISEDSNKSSLNNDSFSNACYVQENVKMFDTSLQKSYGKLKFFKFIIIDLLNAIWKIIKEFTKIVNMDKFSRHVYFWERVGAKKRAKISFDSEEEIDRIKNNQKYKQRQRNTLGVKNSESWITTLNIGNIMHLAPMDFDDMHWSLLPKNISKNSK